jgi:hypothetical protein
MDFSLLFCIEFSPTQLVSRPLGAGPLAGVDAAPSALAMICI